MLHALSLLGLVEMKTNQMRKAKAVYSELAIERKSATVTCILVETQRQAEEWESFMENREGFQCTLTRGRWHEEAVRELTKSWASRMTGWGCLFGFLWLILSCSGDTN